MHSIRAICVATVFIASALNAEQIIVDLDPVKTHIAFVLPDVLHTDATGKFIVPYVQWGMKDPSNFLLKVSDKVELDLTAFGHINGSHRPGV
jgi:hypothetical protein